MFLSTSINVLSTHDPTSYVAFFTPSCINKGFVVVVVVVLDHVNYCIVLLRVSF